MRSLTYDGAEVRANVGWVIERGSPCQYLSFTGHGMEYESAVRGVFQWDDNHIWAIRFARREDAMRVLGALRVLARHLPYDKSLPGLRPDDPAPRVCDHMWIGGNLVESVGGAPDAAPPPEGAEFYVTGNPGSYYLTGYRFYRLYTEALERVREIAACASPDAAPPPNATFVGEGHAIVIKPVSGTSSPDAAPPPNKVENRVWLIERSQPEGESQPWWWCYNQRACFYGHWVLDANAATHYATREQAQSVLNTLYCGEGIPGIHRATAHVSEHVFLGGAEPPREPEDLPFSAIGPDPEAENDPSLHDLETFCAWCGLRHSSASVQRNCPCNRHIDAPEGWSCNAAKSDGEPAAAPREPGASE